MKTKEMIKKVEAMGFEVNDENLKVIVIFRHDDIVAILNRDICFSIETYFDGVPIYLIEDLYNILDAYARTAIPDREDEPKYRYKLDGFKADMNYINLRKIEKTLIINDKHESDFFKTQFTQSDINNLTSEQQKLFEIAVKERVEDE